MTLGEFFVLLIVANELHNLLFSEPLREEHPRAALGAG
jgi:hypothetical protein